MCFLRFFPPEYGVTSVKHAVIIVTVIQISSVNASMACVIAQQRVHPVVVLGNPLTEHKQLLVRACECVQQQVPFFTGWKWFLQAHRSEEGEQISRCGHIISGMH